MFGRLFGIVLSTVFETRLKDRLSLEDARDQLEDSLSQIRSAIETLPGQVLPGSTVQTMSSSDPPELSSVKAELNALKQQLSSLSRPEAPITSTTLEEFSPPVSALLEAPRSECHVLPYRWDPLDGIIAFLARLSNGNPHGKSIFVRGVEPADDRDVHRPGNVAARDDTYFASRDAPDQWIGYDFREARVTLTRYTVRSNTEGANGRLRNWDLEISNDGHNWITIDSQKDNEQLNGPNAVASFPVGSAGEARFVRLRQTGANGGGKTPSLSQNVGAFRDFALLSKGTCHISCLGRCADSRMGSSNPIHPAWVQPLGLRGL
jgi:hypothetical protein